MRHKGLAQATRALWTPRPHGGGHLGSAGVRRGHVRLPPLKPQRKAHGEGVAQSLPLAAGTDLGERENRGDAQRKSLAIGAGLRFSL